MNMILIYFSIKYKGDWDKIFKALEDKEHVDLKEIQALEKMLEEKGYKYITILDSNYPNKLKAAYKPPFVIWYEGDIKLLDNKLLSMVAETKDEVFKERKTEFMPEVEKNHMVVVGNYASISGVKPVVFVADSGLDKIKKGIAPEGSLFISEAPYGAARTKGRATERNRIISSLSELLILFNSKKDSGAINRLVSAFLNMGREIYAFPGDGKENDGNSDLIKSGANLITSIKDIAS